MPAGGGTSQTAVVRAVGGRTQKASLVTAAASAATMLVLATALGLLPQAVLAAIVIVYSVGLIQPLEFAAIRRVRTMEFRWALAAFLGVLLFGTLQGILVAIILSLLGLAGQAAHPRVHVIGRKRGEDVLRPVSREHPDDETFPGLLILRPEGRLFFANAQLVSDRLRELVAEHRPRVLILDLSRVFDIEYSALQMMIEGERRLTEQGVTVWLAGLNPDVLDYVRSSGLADRLGKDRMFANARAGIGKYIGKYLEASSPDDQSEPDADETSMAGNGPQ
jgi:MFS superfamily sulfate permease-like transporter